MKIVKILFLFVCVCAFLSAQLYAQKQVTVINPGFEKPDSGKIKGWDGKCSDAGYTGKLFNIPGWRTDAPDSADFDSGIEPDISMGGKYRAFMMGKDTSMYQILRRISDGDRFELSVDVQAGWQANKFRMEMFYLLDDSVRVFLSVEDFDITSTKTTYTISVNTADYPACIGWKLGILFDNVSDLSQSWLQMDNVVLLNTDPTIIEVPNYSFEQPDSGKIKGWDGPGSCPNLADSQADIPGWNCDDIVDDSGVERNGDVDGEYASFFKWTDSEVWNTTDYTILAGDVLTLRIAARSSWMSDMVHMELYYEDQGFRTTLAASDEALELVGSTGPFNEYSLSYGVDATPASVGKKAGVLLKNSSLVLNSWAAVDLVRLNANHSVVSIDNTPTNPTVFSLAQNYPNPFNPSTKIFYTLKNNGKTRLSVYDILGREVAVLVNEIQTAGPHEVTFLSEGLSSGMYFYKLQAGTSVLTKKMIVLK